MVALALTSLRDPSSSRKSHVLVGCGVSDGVEQEDLLDLAPQHGNQALIVGVAAVAKRVQQGRVILQRGGRASGQTVEDWVKRHGCGLGGRASSQVAGFAARQKGAGQVTGQGRQQGRRLGPRRHRAAGQVHGGGA